MVFLMKVKPLFSAALAQSVSPVLWGNRGLLWPGVAVGGCMGLAREGLSLHARAMGVPGQCCGKPWGWFLPFLLPVWLLAERFGAVICLPVLGAWLRWEAGG